MTIRSACALIINKDASGVEEFYSDVKRIKVAVGVKAKLATMTAE